MAHPRLRYANSGDAKAVLDFWSIAAEDAHRPPDSIAAVERLIHRDGSSLILAIDDGGIVGTVIAGFDGWRCHIYRLAVHPDRRRSGLGKLLVNAAELRFSQLQGTRADAMVLDDNDLGGGMWAALGYTLQPEWSRWVKPLAR